MSNPHLNNFCKKQELFKALIEGINQDQEQKNKITVDLMKM